jgi:hypothetical protein
LNVIVELANLAFVTLASVIFAVVTAFDANSVEPTAPAAMFALSVKFAEPSKDTLPVKSVPNVNVLADAHLLAVEAFPVNAPTKDVDVTDVRPANEVDAKPNEIAVEPIVTDELANAELGTFERPNVIVPDVVIGEPLSTSIPSVPEIATEVTVPELFENGKSDTKPFLTLLSVASW